MKTGIYFLALSACLSAQPVKITWIGQACYLIQTDKVVITDPPAANIGYTLPSINADAVTITHNHSDHNNSAGVKGTFTLVDGRPTTARSEVAAAGTQFVIIPGFHDNTNGSARGQNSIIRWDQGGLRFAHFGDYGQDALTSAQMADLTGLDVIFVPGGGGPTISEQKAAELIQLLKPKAAILMHFRTGLAGPAIVDSFPTIAAPFPDLKFKPSTIELTKAQLPATTEVWLMEVAADSNVVNAASFRAGAPSAPGSLASIFGGFPGVSATAAPSIPLPTTLGGVQVLVGDKPAPLWYVSSQQVNIQIPASFESSQQPVEVRLNGNRIARTSVTLLPAAPGLFVAVDQAGKILSKTTAAKRGDTITIYATGQGPVTQTIADGAGAPALPLAFTRDTPGVYVNGRLAQVFFSGLAPGFPGLWQINAVIPADAAIDAESSLVVLQGQVSNELTIAVQ